MAESFGLVNESLKPKLERKSFFTLEGKVALMFLKMKTQLSGNIHFQLFCGIAIDPTHPLTNYNYPVRCALDAAVEGEA